MRNSAKSWYWRNRGSSKVLFLIAVILPMRVLSTSALNDAVLHGAESPATLDGLKETESWQKMAASTTLGKEAVKNDREDREGQSLWSKT